MVDKQIIIIGAGGHGKEVCAYLDDWVRQGAKVQLVGFIDEEKPKGPFGGSTILGDLSDLKTMLRIPETVFHYMTAVGDNEGRKRLVERIEAIRAENLHAWTFCHPSAYVGQEIQIGEGTCLAPGSLVTASVSLGKHCIVNVKASLSHDCVIGDFANINPGAVICGNVQIGEGCFIGAGAKVIEKVSIGEWAVIGAGAVVTENIPPHVTAVGIPARVIKRHPMGYPP